jgi:hypothetical protein
MARIAVRGTLVQYPVAGMMQCVLAWLAGFRSLGHDVLFFERAPWPDACYDLRRRRMTDDPTSGIALATSALARHGLERAWCFSDYAGRWYGVARVDVERFLRAADVIVDLEYDLWLAEEIEGPLRVFVDGEPGWFQMKLASGIVPRADAYDTLYTTGLAVGTAASSAPTAGYTWRHVVSPVLTSDFPPVPVPANAPFTTVMNWAAHVPMEWQGRTYGQKDVEFERFSDLPGRTPLPLEAAISGKAPRERLAAAGWSLRDADHVTASFDSYRGYIRASRGEFSVAKNVFVAVRTGWFSERSGCYLATGRPVVVQDTGWPDHLPAGEGALAVTTPEEAAEALAAVDRDYALHAGRARELAREHLEAERVLRRFLGEVGL